MKGLIALFLLILAFISTSAQELRVKKRKQNALGGKEFALRISDSTLSLMDREKILFKEIKKGNVPDFLRRLVKIEVNWIADEKAKTNRIYFYVLPDYFAIGSNDDFFYVPMTPILAQKVANLTKCSLPTKFLVDQIYKEAKIKLAPQPIPPTKAMTTLPIFIAHTDSILRQLKPVQANHQLGTLTAGNKKDIIISNKIYGEPTARVVIYGWHKLDGNAIQPVYNKHVNTWVDYSHGVRLIQNSIYINQKKTSLKKALRDAEFSRFFSDEGLIDKPYYPVFKSY